MTAFAEPRIVMIGDKSAIASSQGTAKQGTVKKGLGGTEIDDMAREIMQQQGVAPANPPLNFPQPTASPATPFQPPPPSAAAVARRAQQPTIRVEIFQTAPLVQGKPLVVKFRLKEFRERRYLTIADLQEVHTKKIHVLMVDQTLTDYQHLHPTSDPTDPEIFTYTITPRKVGAYRVWVDITLNNKTHEVIPSYIRGNTRTDDVIDRQIVMQTQQADISASLKFAPSSLVVGNAVMGTVELTDGSGNPLKDLAPIMGAYGHIVAINEDRKTLAHIHPLGDEPTTAEQLGASPLTFHLEPKATGITKIFVQIQRAGVISILPFSVNVAAF
jgi:hypothetical protein